MTGTSTNHRIAIEPARIVEPGRSAEATPGPAFTVGFRTIDERQRVVEWLNRGLRDDRPGRLVSEYPFLFSGNASVFHLTRWEGTRPLSHCVLWAVTFRIGVHRLRVGMISLVYTDPDARGGGLAKATLREAMRRASALELGLVLLWSDLAPLYTSLGFREAGCETLLQVDSASLDRALEAVRASRPEPGVDRLRPADWGAIERLRGHRTCQLDLDGGELGSARTIPDLDARVVRDAEGPVAFAMLGRGDDFRDVVHEWAGEPAQVLRCLRDLHDARSTRSPLMMMAPSEECPATRLLGKHGAHSAFQPMAWMRIASHRALARDLESAWPSPCRLELLPEPAPENAPRLRARSSNGEASIAEHALLREVFGGPPASGGPEPGSDLARIVGPANAALFPIPFYVWGLESI